MVLGPWQALYYELPFGWGGGTTARKNGVVQATQSSVTSNVATLTVVAPHYFTIGDRVLVEGTGTYLDGNEYAITGMTGSTIQFGVSEVDGTTALPTSSIVRPSGKDTFFSNFHLVEYREDFVVPDNWVMIALRNNDLATVEWANGDTVDPGYDSDSPVFKQAIFNSSQDVNMNSDNKPALRVGPPTGNHMRIDGNEIQSMGSSTGAATLSLNANGGITFVGGGFDAPNLVTVSSGAANINYNSSNGRFRFVTSSRRWKRDIRDLGIDVERLLALEPKVFKSQLDEDDPDEDIVGFIAEEADDLGLTPWVDYEADGETPVSFGYSTWVVALQAICRAQQEEIEGQHHRIASLEERLAALEGKMGS